MHLWRLTLMIIIVVGGIAVLASYAVGAINSPGKAAALWGGVPERYLPLYTVSMLLSALSYFFFTYLILFRVNPTSAQLAWGADYRWFIVIYVAMLLPSSLWMPLTIRMVSYPSPAIWLAIRLVLALVGLASVALVISLMTLMPRPEGWLYTVAVIGSIIYCFHCAVLDGIVWPALFPR